MNNNNSATSYELMPRDREREAVLEWIAQLRSVYSREIPLAELSKRREQVPDLPELLWYSFGTVSALLYEISDTYGIIARHKDLTTSQSSRVCSALALLQCIASHPNTKEQFLAAQIPQFLYPILQEKGTKATSIEYLKLTTLGVIGAMVRMDDSKAIQYLLDTEMIPICLHIMEDGTELPRTVATFVLQRILIDNIGLDYVCLTYERFSHVARILGKMILSMSLEETPPQRLLKHAIRCYGRLSDNSRAREALRQCLPDQLRDNTFDKYLKDDPQTKAWLIQLHNNLRTPTTIPYVSPFMGQS